MIELAYKEKRRETRHHDQLPVRVQGTDIRGHFFVEIVLTENVSLSGACITLHREVAVGQRLHVFISNGLLQKQVTVAIRWVDSVDGRWNVGIEFERPTNAWRN